MGTRRQVVQRADDLHLACAAQGHAALAVLGRFDGVSGGERARRPGRLAEIALDQAQRRGLVEPAADQQHRVVGLVVIAVEGLQALDRHIFYVGARADDGAAVVVPQVGGRGHALAQHAIGVVLAGFELVAHHGHFAVEVFLRYIGVHHAVGFQTQRPVQILFVRRKGFVIIGAIERRRAVEAGAVALKLVLDVRVLRRAPEQHVLEQVRHAGFAVAFVARAHQVGDVHRNRVLRGVGEEQHLEPVGKPVLGDAFDRGDFSDRRGSRRSSRCRVDRREQEPRQEQGKRERDNAAQHRDLVVDGTSGETGNLWIGSDSITNSPAFPDLARFSPQLQPWKSFCFMCVNAQFASVARAKNVLSMGGL